MLPLPDVSLAARPLFKDEVLYASTARPTKAGPVTIDEIAQIELVLNDAHSGWRDTTRRQLLDRANAAGVTINAAIEVEPVETAINLVATGVGNTIVSKTIVHSPGFPHNIRTFPLAGPLYDTIAIVQREGIRLAPATQKFAELAENILLSKVGRHEGDKERAI